MGINLFDAIGILVFAAIAFFIYKKGWFFSFYSFIKFLLIFFVSLALAILLVSNNPFNNLPLTNMQLSVIVQGVIFAALWKILNFRKIFFKATDGSLGLNRFIFIHKIDRVLNIFPSALVSLFVCFLMLNLTVSAATANPNLQREIEDSKVVKPVLYQIYFTSFNPDHFGFFNNVAYKLTPPVDSETPGADQGEVKKSAIDEFLEKVNSQREKIGLEPLVSFLVPKVGDPQAPTTYKTIGQPGVVGYKPPVTATPVPAQNQNNPNTNTPYRAPSPIPTQEPYVIPTRPANNFPIFNQPTATPYVFAVTATPQPTLSQQTPVSTPTPFPTPTPRPVYQPPPVNVSQAEQDIFRLTNEERAKNGVPPLAWDDSIAAVARAHSEDMAARNYFSHNTPEGLTPFDRMRAGGISYSAAAENIAGASTPEIIVRNWMNSPGHRNNILNPAYGRLGVGVAKSSKYGLLATQNFAN